MDMRCRSYVQVMTCAVFLAGIAVYIGRGPGHIAQAQAGEAVERTEAEKAPAEEPMSTAVARERAKLLHQVYAATLEVLHERYFHDERAIVPARALEDVFKELDRQTGIKARWISVNMKPMSIQHEPKGDFEKKAAAEMSAGKGDFEQVEAGVYRRAAPIPLSDGCMSCHNGHFSAPPKSPRFAGLIISIPIVKE